jgi:hypothetical protein
VFGAAIAAALFMPEIPETCKKTLVQAHVSVVDVRSLDPNVKLPPMRRSSGGGVVYNGAHKKALLQSMPFLAALLIPIWSLFRRSEDFFAIAVLFIAPLTVVGYTSYAWLGTDGGGGLCLNQRYLLQSLPFFCILAAYAIRYLKRLPGKPLGPAATVAIVLLTAGAYFILTKIGDPDLEALEFPLLTAPLLTACVLAVILGPYFYRFEKSSWFRRAALGVMLAAVVWSGLTASFYDYPNHRLARVVHWEYGRHALKTISPDSIVFAWPGYFTASVRLIDKDRVRIAHPARDGFRDFPRLAAFHLNAGRSVYCVFPNDYKSKLSPRILAPFKIEPLMSFKSFFIGEISFVSPAGAV